VSETTITKGWKGPTGKCDMCNDKKALRWFGDTSVALCGSQKCSETNWDNWNKLREDTKREEDERENGW
jgi:hypothetical protein